MWTYTIVKIMHNGDEFKFKWSWWVALSAISNLSAKKGNAKATLTWTDPDDVVVDWVTLAAWEKTILVRKVWSAPSSTSDWVIVTTSKNKNQYSSTWYEDTGLTNWTTYYYVAFAVSDQGREIAGNTASAKPVASRTFTVSWTENSDPTTWTNTYSDDATWISAWSTDFDEFFWYSAVLVDESWTEVAEVTQDESWGAGNLKISLLQAKWIIDWSSSSTNNVMIKFPKRWIKMSKSWSTVTLSITDEENKEWYQYYAFNANWTEKAAMYLWAYKGSSVSSKLRSISWTSSIWNFSLDTATQAANNTWSWYHEETWYARNLINAYYKMKYANPNSQSVIWMWYVWWSAAQSTWATNSIDTATWATSTTNTWRVKLFWLEDWWWNVWEWLDWAYYSSLTNLQTSSTQAFNSYSSTAANNKISTFDKNTTVASWWMSSIAWTNDWWFAWNWTSWSASTYYCDYFHAYSGRSLRAGGYRDGGDNAGAFAVDYNSASYSATNLGSRLMFL